MGQQATLIVGAAIIHICLVAQCPICRLRHKQHTAVTNTTVCNVRYIVTCAALAADDWFELCIA